MNNLQLLYKSAQNTKQEIMVLDKENKRLADIITRYRDMKFPTEEEFGEYHDIQDRYNDEYDAKKRDLKVTCLFSYPACIVIVIVLCKLFHGYITAGLVTQFSFIAIGLGNKLRVALPLRKKTKLVNEIISTFESNKSKDKDKDKEEDIKCLEDIIGTFLDRQQKISSMTEELTTFFEEYCNEVQKEKENIAMEVMREHEIPASLQIPMQPDDKNKMLKKINVNK